MRHRKEITFFEVFHTNTNGIVETLFSSSNLEDCIKIFRKNKLKNRSSKLVKWLDADYLDSPMVISCILD